MLRKSTMVLSLLIGLFLLSGIGFVVLNWQDETPSADAIRLSKMPQNTIPNDQNSYFFLMGFLAPQGQDPQLVGYQLADDYREYRQNRQTGEEYVAKKSTNFLSFNGKYGEKLICEPSLACLTQPADSVVSAEVEKELQENAELVSRYQRLVQMNAYFDPTSFYPDTPFPRYYEPMQVSRLLLNSAMLKAQQGHYAEILDRIQNDIRYWRAVQSSHSSLISDLIATSMITRNLHWLSALLADPRFDVAAYAPTLQKILTPMTAANMSLAPTLQRETVMAQDFYQEIAQTSRFDMADGINAIEPENFEENHKAATTPSLLDKWKTRLLFHPQASANTELARTAIHQRFAALSPAEWLIQKNDIKSALTQASKGQYCLTDDYCLYNMKGHVLTNIEKDLDFSQYSADTYDLAAHINLVRVQLEARLAQVEPKNMYVFLTEHPELFNPYTNAPFDWDEETRTLSFQFFGKRADETENKIAVSL